MPPGDQLYRFRTAFDCQSPLHEHGHHRSPVTTGGSERLPFRRTFTRKPKAGRRA